MDAWIIAQMCGELCAKGGFDATPQREPIRAWTLSGVERVRFADGATAIFKFAAEPFTSEDRALSFVGSRGVPVPTLYASAVHHRILGMVMEDLGPHTRDATDADGAIAAALLHAVGTAPDLAVYDTAALRELPERALRHLRALTDAGRWPDTTDIADALWTLRAAAPLRSAGTEKAPFGLCHSEFHPTSLHVSESGWRLLDFARAFNGPGLLDLASWHGTLDPADPTRLRGLIESYVQAGGHRDALANRGGRPAEAWALGWHRIWAIEWFLDLALRWIASPDTDPTYIDAVRRHLAEALDLLAV